MELPWWLSGKEFPLPMPATWVQPLVWDDPTHHRASELAHHNYWAWTPEPRTGSYRAHAPHLLKAHPWSLRSTMKEACLLRLEGSPRSTQRKKSPHSKKDPAQKKKIYKIIKTKLSWCSKNIHWHVIFFFFLKKHQLYTVLNQMESTDIYRTFFHKATENILLK